MGTIIEQGYLAADPQARVKRADTAGQGIFWTARVITDTFKQGKKAGAQVFVLYFPEWLGPCVVDGFEKGQPVVFAGKTGYEDGEYKGVPYHHVVVEVDYFGHAAKPPRPGRERPPGASDTAPAGPPASAGGQA
jgi:hypothetical protein